jgi:hypothetical protein
LEKDESKETDVSTHRRRFLKSAAATSAAAASLSGSAAADTNNRSVYYAPNDEFAVSGYQKEQYYYSFSYDDWYRIDFTVKGLGGYSKTTGNWGTTFRNHAYGALRRFDPSYDSPYDDPNSKKLDQLEGHELSYADKDDGNESILAYKYGEGYLGGCPAPQYTSLEATEDAVEELGKVAVSAISSVADLVFTANNLYQNISDSKDDDTSDTDGENQTFSWPYGGSYVSDKQSDISQYNEIDYEQEYDCVSTFFTQSRMYEGSVDPAVNWKVEVESPTSSTSTTTTTTSDTGPPTPENPKPDFSPETIKKFGLRKVPISDLEAQGIDLVDPLVLDGNKTWWADNVHGSISMVDKEKTPF